MGPAPLIPVFDLDGTLLDSDQPLVDAFVALGVSAEAITFGHVLGDECERLGIDVEAYLDAYDHGAAVPFDGVSEVVAALANLVDRWAVCSNKHPRSGRAELARLGWHPTAAFFSDAFDGPKALPPVLETLEVGAERVVFIGDTDHDRVCATAVGARFALAGWNPRARPAPGDLVLEHPSDLLAVLA